MARPTHRGQGRQVRMIQAPEPDRDEEARYIRREPSFPHHVGQTASIGSRLRRKDRTLYGPVTVSMPMK